MTVLDVFFETLSEWVCGTCKTYIKDIKIETFFNNAAGEKINIISENK